KIDQLTRSLADFAKIVEILDARSASFVGSDQVPFAALAEREGVSPSYFTRLVRLSYLAPDITHAILDVRQPRDMTAEQLLEHSRLPLAWHTRGKPRLLGSHLTLRWREPDSNHRYRVTPPKVREGSCRLCLIPPNGKVAATDSTPGRRRAPFAAPT